VVQSLYRRGWPGWTTALTCQTSQNCGVLVCECRPPTWLHRLQSRVRLFSAILTLCCAGNWPYLYRTVENKSCCVCLDQKVLITRFQMVAEAIHCEASSGLQAGAVGNLFVSPISWKLGVRCAIWELLVARSGRFHDDFGRMSYEQIGKQGANMEHTWGQIFPLTLGAGNWEWWNLQTFADFVCSSS